VHGSLSKSGIFDVLDLKSTLETIAKAKIDRISAVTMRLIFDNLVKKHSIKYVLAQQISGRMDRGEVFLWLLEDGKLEIKALSTPFNDSQKLPFGAIDTALLTALLVFEPDGGPGTAAVEIEKFGDMTTVLDTYKRLAQDGILFSRRHQLEVTSAIIKGKSKVAAEQADKALALDPFWPDNWKSLVQSAKKFGTARTLPARMQLGLSKYPDNVGLILLLLDQLDPQTNAMQFQALLERAGKIEPDNPALIELEVGFSLDQGTLPPIPALVDRYFASNRTNAHQSRKFGLKTARALHSQGQPELAVQIYSTILEDEPQASIYLEKARGHKAMGDLKGMLIALLAAYDDMPDDTLLWAIVDSARDSGELALALNAITATAKKNYDDPTGNLIAGLLYMLLADSENAGSQFDRAIELSEEPAKAAMFRLTLAYAFALPEQILEAKADYSGKYGPADMIDLGLLLTRLRFFAQGEEVLLPYLKLEEPRFDVAFNYWLCAIGAQNFRGARKALKIARKIEATDAKRLGLMVAVEYGMKRKERVLEELLEVSRTISENKSTDTDDRLELFRYQIQPNLENEVVPVTRAYFEFLDGKVTWGALAHKFTAQ
jgi:tetratricopeptide (TPR) repeat protein